MPTSPPTPKSPTTLLAEFTSTTAVPASSRIDPSLEQRLPPEGGILAWTLKDWANFVWFCSTKGIDIASSLAKYMVWGPPKKSWGIEMTLISAFMRRLADHTSFADINLIRTLINVHYLLPIPPDAMITPITFKVKRRKEPLRGFFKELDLAEDGERELSGEWVVCKQTWRRLKRERRSNTGNGSGSSKESRSRREDSVDRSGGRSRSSRTSSRASSGLGLGVGLGSGSGSGSGSIPNVGGKGEGEEKKQELVVFYIHGGAYYVGSPSTHRTITLAISRVCDCRVFALNYRLAPECKFPSALHDVIHTYFRLINTLHISPSNLLVIGDSAGGGLAIALNMYLRDEGYRMPRGLVVMSPWCDLTMSCKSWETNCDIDVIPVPMGDDHLNPVQCYLGKAGLKEYLTHPYVSPLFGDFRGLPPMLITAGSAEVLCDEITLLAHKATLAGVDVTSELYVDAVHVFQTFPFLESATAAFKNLGLWLEKLKTKEYSKHPGASKEVLDLRVRDVIGQDVTQGKPDSLGGSPRGSVDIPIGTDSIGDEIRSGLQGLLKQREASETPEKVTVLGTTLEGITEDESSSRSPSSSRPRSPSDATIPKSAPVTPSKPLLRRAFSSFSRSAASASARRPSVSFFMPGSTSMTSLSAAASPAGSPRARRQTQSQVMADHTLTPTRPTTRVRSKSNVDVAAMMDAFAKSGPANQTTVYNVYTPDKRGGVLPAEGPQERSEIEAGGSEVTKVQSALGLMDLGDDEHR